MFRWGELSCRLLGSKSSKDRILSQATYSGAVFENEEIEYICCRARFSVFVLSDGRVYTLVNEQRWRGQPELVNGLQEHKIHAVDSGTSHILFVSEAGNVFLTEFHNKKRGANTKLFNTAEPQLLRDFAEICVIQVACGNNHSLALCKDGQVFAWGQNSRGQLGVGKAGRSVPTPRGVTSLAGVPLAQIAAGGSHSFALSVSGAVFAWGSNDHGQLGLNDMENRYHPTEVKLLDGKKMVYISCGGQHTATLTKDGLVFTFGAGRYGQLGHNTTTDELKPQLVEEFVGSKVTQIACGSYHTLVLVASSGKIYSFGRGVEGQLGNGRTSHQSVPRPVTFSMDVPDRVRLAPAAMSRGDSEPTVPERRRRVTRAAAAKANSHKRTIAAQDAFPPTGDAAKRMRISGARGVTPKFSSDGVQPPIIVKPKAAVSSEPHCRDWSSEGNHFKTSSVDPGVDMSAVTLWFEKLGKNLTLLQEVTNAVENKLIPSLSKSTAGVEALRVYLVLPELIDVLMEQTTVVKLTSLLSTAIVSLEESQLEILESWWSHLNEFFFTKLVMLYKSVSYRLLQESSRETKEFPDKLCNCLNVLQRLYKINSTSSLKIQENTFYISPAEVFGGTSISCVKFVGESGIDEGSVSQEFFSIITKELCTLPKAFKLYEESRLVWFPEWEPEIDDLFRLVGILCWLALYHGLVADFHFPLALYKKLLRVRPTLDDLKELSPTVGQNLQELLNYENDDIEDVFCQDFTVGREMDDGSIVEHELIPNGKNIPVQKHNRRQFVDAYVDYVFNTSVQKHFKAFSEGFRWAVPLPVVDVFLPVELMAAIHGNTKYDWQLLEEHTKYQGYTKADQNIVTFWEMFHELTEDEKKHFLAFLTGCERVPVGGMGSLSITIRREMWEDPDLYFPVAHTCSWTLDLPQYSSGEILRERFLRAIGCCKGFGIA
uniref:probable E3 ubiquitin-protein ligase HERC3 n=1 Tax=Pristiophorus japonicus TaxID=55135 RepID=UPI00398F60B6